MALLGTDFVRARHEWLYNPRLTQPVVVAFGLFAVLILLHLLVYQTAMALLIYPFLYGDAPAAAAGTTDAAIKSRLITASVVGIAPAALLTIATAFWFRTISTAGRNHALALNWPRLGVAGWILTIVGFLVVMYATVALLVLALGIDPNAYSPTGGLNADNSSGLIERAMAELRQQPLLFAFTLPGIVVLVPFAEELLFRGVLFAAIAQTPVGRWGAVLITAAGWAVVHAFTAPWFFVGVIFIMGVVLGVLLLRFGSLWITTACHAVWNGITSAAIFGLAS